MAGLLDVPLVQGGLGGVGGADGSNQARQQQGPMPFARPKDRPVFAGAVPLPSVLGGPHAGDATSTAPGAPHGPATLWPGEPPFLS